MTLLSTAPPLIVLATGLTFVIGAGEIDLSFPAVISFSGFVFAILFKDYHLGWIAVLAALVSGVLIGVINGLLITKMGIPSFIATLGTQFSGREWPPFCRAASPTRCVVQRIRMFGPGS
jgi:simple sugar transport system permease protein